MPADYHHAGIEALRSKLRIIFDPSWNKTALFCSLTPRQAVGNALAGGIQNGEFR
jgi:hypothetical protein